MNIEFISKNNARRKTLETLKEFLKKNKDKIDELMAREAKGMAKLEKNEQKTLRKGEVGLPSALMGAVGPVGSPGDSGGAAPPMGAPAPANLCMGCGGEDTEPLGNHMGLDHFMCRDCGEVGVTIKEENQQADQNQAQDALAAMASQSLAPMVKKDPSDTSEDNRENTPKDETENAYKAAWLNQKKKKKGEVKKTAIPMGKSVESIRQAAGLTGAPKMPSVKAPSIPVTGATAPQKDAFNTGGMNPTTAAAMNKAEKKPFNTGAGHGGVPAKEVPNQDVAVESAREGTVPPPEEGGKEISSPGSGGQIKKTSLKKDEMAPSPLCKVSDIRAKAAAKYAAKRQQTAADVKAIQAVQSAVQKADGIPAAPKAPGASAVNSAPAKAPSNQAPQASSPTPPKL